MIAFRSKTKVCSCSRQVCSQCVWITQCILSKSSITDNTKPSKTRAHKKKNWQKREFEILSEIIILKYANELRNKCYSHMKEWAIWQAKTLFKKIAVKYFRKKGITLYLLFLWTSYSKVAKTLQRTSLWPWVSSHCSYCVNHEIKLRRRQWRILWVTDSPTTSLSVVRTYPLMLQLHWSESKSESDVAWNALLVYYAVYLYWSESDFTWKLGCNPF